MICLVVYLLAETRQDKAVTMNETRDIRLEQALFSLQLVLAGVDLDCQGVAGLESNKGAVEQNHLYEPGCRPC